MSYDTNTQNDTSSAQICIHYSVFPVSHKFIKLELHASNICSKTVAGEHPAAIQYGGQLRLQYPVSVFLLSIFVTLIGS
jgi:hypothetical protein